MLIWGSVNREAQEYHVPWVPVKTGLMFHSLIQQTLPIVNWKTLNCDGITVRWEYVCRPVMKTKKVKTPNQKRGPKKAKGRASANLSEQMSRVVLAPSVAKKTQRAPKADVVSLPKCTLRYALACSDPFHPGARKACVPVGSAPTMKVTAFARTDIVFGASGIAYVMINPSTANDCPSALYTTSGVTVGSAALPYSASATLGAAGTGSALVAGWANLFHNGPFSAAQLIGGETATISTTAPVSGRIVAVGMRSQYTGTTLNESGLHYCYHAPDHVSLSGVTSSTLSAFGDVNIEGVSRKPCMLTVHGTTDSELSFAGQNPINDLSTQDTASILYPYSSGNWFWNSTYAGATSFRGGIAATSLGTFVVPVGAPVAVYAITGVAGASAHLEFIFHMEYTGAGAASMLSDNASDPEGAAMVRTAALTLPQKKLDNPTADAWSLMHAALKEGAKAAVEYIVPLAKSALFSLLM